MIDEHSREDELIIQIIGLKGKIEKLQEEKKKYIEEFQSDFEEVVRYFKLDGHLIATKRRKWEEKKVE
ncbi:hypothetical protein LCGC14_1402920 [marine sediment metagenome]|uniref:Uncharacterized protein n=1 Tax=marine sediment metagenome TaxID=412755 RepID=A0A0F9KHF2_9ZZZZ